MEYFKMINSKWLVLQINLLQNFHKMILNIYFEYHPWTKSHIVQYKINSENIFSKYWNILFQSNLKIRHINSLLNYTFIASKRDL